jgi:hypothetical protein
MKSYNNITELFAANNNIESFVDEGGIYWYKLEDVEKVIPLNMEWYKSLFTLNTLVVNGVNGEETKFVTFMTKAALMIALQNTETKYGEYLRLLREYDSIRYKLDEIEDELFHNK